MTSHHEKRAALAIEDRITGLLVRKGVALDKLEAMKQEIAERLRALVDANIEHEINWRDVEIIANILLHGHAADRSQTGGVLRG